MAIIPNPLDPSSQPALQHFHAELVPGLADIEMQLGQWYAQLLQWYDSRLCDIERKAEPFWSAALADWAQRTSLAEATIDNLIGQLGMGFDFSDCVPATVLDYGGGTKGFPSTTTSNGIVYKNFPAPANPPYCQIPGYSYVSETDQYDAYCQAGEPAGGVPGAVSPVTVTSTSSSVGCTLTEQRSWADPQEDWDKFGYDISYKDWSEIIPYSAYLTNAAGEVVYGQRLNADFSITIPGGITLLPSMANHDILADGNSWANKKIQDQSEGSPFWLCNHPGGSAVAPSPTSQPGTIVSGSPGQVVSPVSGVAAGCCDVRCPAPIINVACSPTPINVTVQVPSGALVPTTGGGQVSQGGSSPALPPSAVAGTLTPPPASTAVATSGTTAVAEWSPPMDDVYENILDAMGFDRPFVEWFRKKLHALGEDELVEERSKALDLWED